MASRITLTVGGVTLFQKLGNVVTQKAAMVTACWVVLLVGSMVIVPEWSSVAENGEFAFLPADSPSVVAEEKFRKYFSKYSNSSNVALVVRREVGADGLTEKDRTFINNMLFPRLCEMFSLDEYGRPQEDALEAQPNSESAEGDEDTSDETEVQSVAGEAGSGEPGADETTAAARSAGRNDASQPQVRRLIWYRTNVIGKFYDSEDQSKKQSDKDSAEKEPNRSKATLIVLELDSEFLDQGNMGLIDRLESEIDSWRRLSATAAKAKNEARKEDVTLTRNVEYQTVPQGLDISLSGTATYGRDAIREADRSGEATEKWTIILVVVLLLAMYRAPLLALVPLLTVSVATEISVNLLAIAADHEIVRLFNGIKPYITVLVYGAGVDYCLFLIARYREELDEGASIEEGISTALSRVGSALTASAGTTMCGIGMMAFALFGKFQQAGIAIAFGLFVCLVTSLTLAPAVLRLFGRWAFWPNIPARQPSGSEWVSSSGLLSQVMKLRLLHDGWKKVGQALLRRPMRFWAGSILALLPFAICGLFFYGHLSYGLLTDLPPEAPSVQGARALQAHFPGGEGVPVRVLVDVPGRDFSSDKLKAPEDILELTERIKARDDLGIQAVRSLGDPTGGRDVGIKGNPLRERVIRKLANDTYNAADRPSLTRLDLIFRNDAFSRTSIDEFRNMREALPKMLPETMKGAEIYLAGETAGLSDLKAVTDSDRTFINSLVVGVVFIILWILLKRPWLCSYLMMTVLLSYFATLGITFLFFWLVDPGFAGLDWKVPMFLFTILIAVGQDYNIFLITRIEEESREAGPIDGIVLALDRTGSIISSCGIIMAGTFSSLMAGSLMAMDQLGFALALGVILDTFVIRPIMVPAFLILLARRRERLAAAQPAAEPAAAAQS